MKMECLINLIVFATLIVVCSGNTGNIPINQHKCKVQGSSLECKFTVPGVYSPDRLLPTISSVEFDFFGEGSIQIDEKEMPDLTLVEIKDGKAVCRSIHVGQTVKVVVGGKECREEEEITTTETSEASVLHESKTTPPATSRTSSQNVIKDEQTINTFRIVVIVLSGLTVYMFINPLNLNLNRQVNIPHPRRWRRHLLPGHPYPPPLRRGDRNHRPPNRFQAGL